MKTRSITCLLFGAWLLTGCTEQSAQLQALASAAEKKANEATLEATRLQTENKNLQAEVERLKGELAAVEPAGSTETETTTEVVLPTPKVTDELEFALFKDTKTFKASFEEALAGYSNIRFVSGPSIVVAEQVATPYSMPLGLIATNPEGKTIFSEFEAKADWEGNWKFPELDAILAGVKVGDPTSEVAGSSAGGSETASNPSEGTGEVAENSGTDAPAGGDSSPDPGTTPPGEAPKPKPQPPAQQPSFLQGKRLSGSAKVDWNRTITE